MIIRADDHQQAGSGLVSCEHHVLRGARVFRGRLPSDLVHDFVVSNRHPFRLEAKLTSECGTGSQERGGGQALVYTGLTRPDGSGRISDVAARTGPNLEHFRDGSDLGGKARPRIRAAADLYDGGLPKEPDRR